MIKAIGHIAYKVTDMEKAIDFYCGVLGLEKAFELADENGLPWIVYIKVVKNQFIELFYDANIEGNEPKNETYMHLCLEVTDIHEIAEKLQKHGIVLDILPKQAVDLNYQCWAKDPDGNPIEFMQIHSDSPQAKA